MRQLRAALVLVDIFGYTRFVMLHRTAMMHAEQIVTELLQSVTDAAQFPLTVAKLEGDAVFLYAELGTSERAAVNDIARQIFRFSEVFRDKQHTVFQRTEGGCICDACQNVGQLHIKSILHVADVIEKQVGERTELAGEGVILLHRLAKNSVTVPDYVMMTKEASSLLDFSPHMHCEDRREEVADFGKVDVVVCAPHLEPIPERKVRPLTRLSAIGDGIRLYWKSLLSRGLEKRDFRNLPEG